MLSIFDHTLQKISSFTFTKSVSRSVSGFAYKHTTGGKVITLWFDNLKPGDSNLLTPVDFSFPGSVAVR